MTKTNYWAECISSAAEDCGLTINNEQLQCISEAVAVSFENYGLAFYSPPAQDRLHDIEHEYKNKIKTLEAEIEKYEKIARDRLEQLRRVERYASL